MRTTTIPAYLYGQYANDADLQAFFAAFNDGAQSFVTWLASVNLPYWPGLSGGLLDWVAQGLYGIARPAFEEVGNPAVGTLNSRLLNAGLLNVFTAPGTSSYYTLSDDLFQRIMTWNLYKADGRRFCVRWLKRRIMRFLAGANGLDPVPPASGAENTQAISVSVSAGALSVTIHSAALASIITVPSGLLALFRTIFLSGVLELPAYFSYSCTVS